MSVQTDPTDQQDSLPDQHQPPDTAPADAFSEHIWHNDEVCNHCFARVRRVEEATIRVGTNNQKELDWEHRDRTSHATLDHDVESTGTIGTIVARDDEGRAVGTEPRDTHSVTYQTSTRTTCLECGSIGCLATDATLSRRDALDRVDALVARLRELGFEVSEYWLRETVRHGKTSDKWQGFDKEIFAAAVKVGIRRG